MKIKIQSNTVTTGLAMFSMFFGAGNVVFPLSMGQYAQDKNFYAIMGLLISAVGVPFLGLMSMTLFDGNYKHFFERIGKWPGFIISIFIMGLIGPFGAMPRLLALSYSTSSTSIPNISLPIFSIISCIVIFVLTYKRSRILDILGYFLTPILLGSLAIVIVRGLLTSTPPATTDLNSFTIFINSLHEGYKTMDLMGAFFFSSVVILCLKKELHPKYHRDYKKLITMTLKAGCIGASLLGIVYVGFSYLAAFNSEILSPVSQDKLLSKLTMHVLGPYAGIIAIVSVALACLTTAIALSAVFSEFLHEDIFLFKVNYHVCLIATLVATYFMSTLEFAGIMRFLEPIITVCYPALIMLSIVNILHKLYDFKPVKIPVFVVFVISFISYFV